MKTLEMISDTFLPVNEIAQFALPQILKGSTSFLKSYKATVQDRRADVLEKLSKRKGISLVKPEGGFFVTVKLENKILNEEKIAVQLLRRHRVLVHPGYFYDMEEQHLVFGFVGRRTGPIRQLLNGIDEI
jgi:aspartate/methionine/tyrosine aminotransferase